MNIERSAVFYAQLERYQILAVKRVRVNLLLNALVNEKTDFRILILHVQQLEMLLYSFVNSDLKRISL